MAGTPPLTACLRQPWAGTGLRRAGPAGGSTPHATVRVIPLAAASEMSSGIQASFPPGIPPRSFRTAAPSSATACIGCARPWGIHACDDTGAARDQGLGYGRDEKPFGAMRPGRVVRTRHLIRQVVCRRVTDRSGGWQAPRARTGWEPGRSGRLASRIGGCAPSVSLTDSCERGYQAGFRSSIFDVAEQPGRCGGS